MILIDIFDDGPAPKRGDLVQTNVGKPRERTWFVLHAHRVNRIVHIHDRERALRDMIPRFKLWTARWWELEPDMRMRLYRSAERNGGQNVHPFFRYPAKKKNRDSAFSLPHRRNR